MSRRPTARRIVTLALLAVLAGCQDEASPDAAAAGADQTDLLDEILADVGAVAARYEREAQPVIAECMHDAGFDYAPDQNGPVGSTEAEQRAYGDALFGPEDQVAQVMDGDGRVVMQYTVGGCLGRARDAVGSRQAYLTIQRTQWDAETLNGLRTPQGWFGRQVDIEDDAQDLLEAWRPQRDRILARLDEVAAR